MWPSVDRGLPAAPSIANFGASASGFHHRSVAFFLEVTSRRRVELSSRTSSVASVTAAADLVPLDQRCRAASLGTVFAGEIHAMPIFVMVTVIVGLVAIRWPIVEHIVAWLLLFPLATLAGGTVAWAIVIQRWDTLYSFSGYATTLAIFAIPAALLVVGLGRS